MNAEIVPKRVRFAFPFAILTKPDTVRLVAGEEFRYTLRSPSLEQWLPQLLSSFAREVEWRPFAHAVATSLGCGRERKTERAPPRRRFCRFNECCRSRRALPGYSRLRGRPRFQLALPPVRRGRVALDFVRTYGPRIRQLRIPATRRALSRMFDPKFSTAFACPRDL